MADKTIHDFTVNDIDGKSVSLSQYKGKVLLIVNVASRCGNTPQYAGLEALYKEHKDKGFEVLGFPANNFMGQEPGSDAEIKKFCSLKYRVTFPMFSKISVKGQDIAPLYEFLTKTNSAHAGEIDWNFAKFIIGRDGSVLRRFAAKVPPENPQLRETLASALDA